MRICLQNRREFLDLAAGATAASLLQSAPAKKPNFLIILADDMGFSDARCYGGDKLLPHEERRGVGARKRKARLLAC
jgi:hypothetical protein